MTWYKNKSQNNFYYSAQIFSILLVYRERGLKATIVHDTN